MSNSVAEFLEASLEKILEKLKRIPWRNLRMNSLRNPWKYSCWIPRSNSCRNPRKNEWRNSGWNSSRYREGFRGEILGGIPAILGKKKLLGSLEEFIHTLMAILEAFIEEF